MKTDLDSAIDCHIHVVGDTDRYPMAEHRSYTPPPARFEDYLEIMAATSVRRAVLVQPSCYGTDNRLLLDALNAFGDAVRGVAVVDPKSNDDRQMADMHARGVRSVRVNLMSVRDHIEPMEISLPAIDQTLRGSGWHIQVFTAAETLAQLADLQPRLHAPLVIDHFGFVRPETRDRHLPDLIRLLQGGAWVKLSGTDRIADGPASPGVSELVRELYRIAPDRCLWGSDWPHTPMHSGVSLDLHQLTPYRRMDTAGFYSGAASWFDNDQERQAVFVDNPSRLYDWPITAG